MTTQVTQLAKNNRDTNYVQIDEALCNGCVLCMKVCPTKAIRVKDHRVADFVGVCIDCGECIRVCPRGAIKAVTTPDNNIDKSNSVLSFSPVLCSQFFGGDSPDKVYSGLKKMGFFDVVAPYEIMEMFNVAMGLYINENRKKKGAPRPLISPVCPVVVRLIAFRFPSLLKNIPPILPPRELVAREIKKHAMQVYGRKVKVFHVTPCSAKMISIKQPIMIEKSYLDGAIGINNVFVELMEQVRLLGKEKDFDRSVGIAIGWGKSGGEIEGIGDGNFLAVSGMQETIGYLQKIEMGLHEEVDYVEFRTCPEGCLGGALTVGDKYQAKHNLQWLIKKFGVERLVSDDDVKKLYKKDWFFVERKEEIFKSRRSGLSLSKGIERQKKVEETHQLLPQKECGVCGSPDCRTFAEDVVDGRASLESCIFLSPHKANGEKR